MRRSLLATALLLLLLPVGAAIAANRPRDLLIDACRDEKVDGTYSQSTYRKALAQLPADSDQYTACRDVINRARLAALNSRGTSSGGGSGGGGGGAANTGGGGTTGGGASTSAGTGGGPSGTTAPDATGKQVDVLDTATPAEQSAVKKATQTGAGAVRVGGELIQPGAMGSLAAGRRELPTSLIVLLVALAASAVLGAATIGWNRVLARRAR
jgi:hypothetical protein